MRKENWGSGGKLLKVENSEGVEVVIGLPGEVFEVASDFVEGGRIPEVSGKLDEHEGIFVMMRGQEEGFVGADREVSVWVETDRAAGKDGADEVGREIPVGLVGRFRGEWVGGEWDLHGKPPF